MDRSFLCARAGRMRGKETSPKGLIAGVFGSGGCYPPLQTSRCTAGEIVKDDTEIFTTFV